MPPSPTGPAAQCCPDHKIDFNQLASVEQTQIEQSRAIRFAHNADNGAVADRNAPLTALCISGGGVRSATFATGVINTLSQGPVPALTKIDYLSTVSGGGYLGSFVGMLFRQPCPPDPPTTVTAEAAEPPQSGAGAAQRVHYQQVLAKLADRQSGPMRYLKQRGRFLADSGDEAWQAATVVLRNLFWLHTRLALLLTPVFVLLYLLLNLSSLWLPTDFNAPWAMAYLRYWPWPLALLPAVFVVVTCLCGLCYFLASQGEGAGALRRTLTSVMAQSLGAALGFSLLLGGAALTQQLVLAAGQQPMVGQSFDPSGVLSWLVGLYALIVALSGAVYKVYKTIQSVAGSLLKFRTLLTIVAVAAALMYLFVGFSLCVVSLTVLQHAYSEPFNPVIGQGYWTWLLALVVGPLLLHVLFNFLSQSANFTSLHYFYKFRLRRAFLAAANPARYQRDAHDDRDWHEQDEAIDIRGYLPTQAGGPLHLINITVNNSRSPDGKLWWPDCKGKNLALSGLGYNYDLTYQPWDTAQRVPLELSAAVAISGAAASTGMGQMSSFATSLLTGLFNLRLGFWWPARRQANEPFARLFFKEITNRYTAAEQDPWYLSDGGHFENLAVYEMLRRRVERMLVLDGGQDQLGQFDDLANLIRRARLDFSCELTLCEQAPPEFYLLADHLGTPASLKADDSGFSQHRVLLYRIDYPADSWYAKAQPAKTGWLLYIKPTLQRGDPLDLLQYKHKEPDFPHQTTADQFFDETQWESYRKLGEVISQELEPAIQQFLR